MLSISHNLRRVIFFILVGAFFLTAGVVLFHTFGYRFSTERGIFIYTGSLTLKSNPPSGLEISIDGKQISRSRSNTINNSIHISGMPPGEHLIQVAAPGFHPWTKKVVIESGRSTEFWNIQLVRTEPEVRTLPHSAHVHSLAFGPENDEFLLVKHAGDEYTLDRYNVDTEQSEQIFSSTDPIVPTRDKPLTWSPNGRILLVPQEDPSDPYAILDLGTLASRRLTNVFSGEKLSNVRFDPTAENLVFFRRGSELYRLDVEIPDSAPVLLHSHVAAFEISGRSLYFLESQNGIVYRTPIARDTFTPVQLTREPLPLSSLGNQATYQMAVYDDDRFAILEETQGRLFIHNSEAEDDLRELPAQGVTGMQFSDDGKKLLYYSPYEILVYFVREWEVQPAREADSLHQIARFSQEIKHVGWSKNYEHVLFTLGTDLKLIELDSRDHRNIQNIASFSASPLQITTDFAENLIHVVSPEEADSSVPVIRAVSFPEPTGFFRF